ncbi:hypothetical protein, partial [Mycolicibacterium brumae]
RGNRPPADRTARSAAPARDAKRAPRATPTPKRTRARSASQAKARAKAAKAKAPKLVRVPLRVRLLTRLSSIDLNPRTLARRVPFVVLVIGALGIGLGVTLWLSTDAAERSYQLGSQRQLNQVLQQQKESLERQVLEAQAAPALAEAARQLGMIPSSSTAHLVQDPSGMWTVVGTPKPADGAPPPPLNVKLPDEKPLAPAPKPRAEPPADNPAASPERPVPVSPNATAPNATAPADPGAAEVPVLVAPHGVSTPGAPGPAPGPVAAA